MKGINKTIFELIKTKLHLLTADPEILKSLRRDIKAFLKMEASNYKNRQKLAVDIIRAILKFHKKGELYVLADHLADLELNLQDLQRHQRDHVCHAVLTFLLGFAIICEILNPEDEAFIFQWKLAALLHDIGYPLEIADNTCRDFLNLYEEKVLGIDSSFQPQMGRYLKGHLSLYSVEISAPRNTLDLVQNRLRRWDIPLLVHPIFQKMIQGQRFDRKPFLRTDHGIASTILVMKAIDKKYKENNPSQTTGRGGFWDYKHLNEDITDVCAALFIHNLDIESLTYDFDKARLATLLKVCDELQDWDRPKANPDKTKPPKINPPVDYHLEFVGDRLLFYAKEEYLKDIQDGLKQVNNNFPYDIDRLTPVMIAKLLGEKGLLEPKSR